MSTRKKTLDEAASLQLKELRAVVEQLVEENKELKNKIQESLDSTQFASNKYDENNNKLNEVLEKLSVISKQNKLLIEKNALLEKEISMHKRERMEMEKQLFEIITPIEVERREKNLEVHGLPEGSDENCTDVVKAMISKITPESVNVSKCFRFGRKETVIGEKRIRPILLEFDNKKDRDIVFNSRSNLRKLNDPIYINENLPKHLKILRGKANTRRKEYNYKYLWTKNGNILLRKNEESNVINIKASIDLEKIC